MLFHETYMGIYVESNVYLVYWLILCLEAYGGIYVEYKV